MTPDRAAWLATTEKAAAEAGHIFPKMAACEAALESDFGQSFLAKAALNLFGMKQHEVPEYDTLTLPTREFLRGAWAVVDANFVKYPYLAACFKDRMATLTRLAPSYPNYAAALRANTAEEYITAVSKTWSTDPDRANKVLKIYAEAAA